MTLRVAPAKLAGVFVVSSSPIVDERGFFMRTFDSDTHAGAGVDHASLVQENHSRSRRGVIRGLHCRNELSEAKLIRCVRGEVFDVAVDLRPWSPTFLQWERWILDDAHHLQVYLPPGLAHGFQTLSEWADVVYRVDSAYVPERDVAIAHDDPELGIPWPIESAIVSLRDRSAPRLRDVRDELGSWFGETAPGG